MKNKPGKIQDLIDEKFIEQRKIFLWGGVDDKSAKHVIDRLLYLDSISDKEIQFFINSPGGFVTDGFAIYDTMKALNSPVATICSGLSASMGSILLSGGTSQTMWLMNSAAGMAQPPRESKNSARNR